MCVAIYRDRIKKNGEEKMAIFFGRNPSYRGNIYMIKYVRLYNNTFIYSYVKDNIKENNYFDVLTLRNMFCRHFKNVIKFDSLTAIRFGYFYTDFGGIQANQHWRIRD